MSLHGKRYCIMAFLCFAILARRIGDGRGFGMTLRTCIFGREERNGKIGCACITSLDQRVFLVIDL
jgi:hypothetical protein